jgi:hypothetical protein
MRGNFGLWFGLPKLCRSLSTGRFSTGRFSTERGRMPLPPQAGFHLPDEIVSHNNADADGTNRGARTVVRFQYSRGSCLAIEQVKPRGPH